MEMTLRKVVIPAAGLGTRLLPATKEQPKEMLPVLVRSTSGMLVVKPVLQIIFEELFDFGLREFCFIVGRGKRVIEDHFTPDYNFVSLLKNMNHELVNELEVFYRKIEQSVIIFSNQPKPRGFGDAILHARPFVGDEDFLVHAGDDLILSTDSDHLRRLITIYETNKLDAAFLIEEVDDPSMYGVIVGEEVDSGIYRVKKIMEKPETPPSNLAVVAIYTFTSKIFKVLAETSLDPSGELQLTDAIHQMLARGCNVYAVKLRKNEKRVEIGTPETYWKALKTTFNQASL